MYSLLLLALLGSALGLPTKELERNVNYEHYVLPGESYPTFYDVRLFLDPDNSEYFYGNVSIRIIPVNYTNVIVLQAMEMTIDDIQVFSDRNNLEDLYANHTHATDDTHFLRITMNTELVPLSPYVVHISYTSKFAENMFGVYISTYTEPGVGTVNLITSQLQPTFARRAFPCYDEPYYKAIFRTTIYAPPKYPIVRSNMPERSEQEYLQPNVPGWNKFEFRDTLIMSSYLIAYLVSQFQHITNEDSLSPIYHVPFRVYSRPGTQDTAEFALDYGQKNMVELEKYYDFLYEFPKVDKAAVPDFAAGAMENWGLVIYREVALLVREGITTTATRQNIGRIICHENVHMWFGNEVSPVSWTYTWLNEGFANFFENYGTDLVLPEWRMMDQFVLLLQNVMQSDAILSVNSMTHPVFTPSQIIGTFNAVAYQKSGSVLRMTQHYMTPEIFQQGLRLYLRANTRRAVTPPALYESLQAALDASNHSVPWPIATIMDRWTNQGGFPVITVRRSAPTADSFFVSQVRYLTDGSLSSTDRWHVPINWVLSTNVDFSDTSPQAWVPPSFPAVSIDIPNFSQATWYIVNKQQTGYYRVNYDLQNWNALINVITTNHSIIHVLNRAQIIDDSFNLARTGRLNYIIPLSLSRYLRNEQDYIPWGSASNAYSYLDVVLSGTPAYALFQAYVLNLSAPLFEKLRFVAQPGEEHVTAYHRNIILDLNCRYGNTDCVNEAQSLLEQFRNNTIERLNPDIQTIVYCSGLRGGSVDNFNFLWQQYLASTDSSEQSILLNALGCTSNAQLRDFYLNQVINETSAVREQDRHTILVSVINSSPEGMEAALSFVLENFHLIQPRVQGLTGTTNILNAFSRRLTTPAHSVWIDTFFNRHQSIFSAGEQASIAAIRENIAASIAWSNNNFNIVNSWLQESYGSNASILTSGLLIILSAILTIHNY